MLQEVLELEGLDVCNLSVLGDVLVDGDQCQYLHGQMSTSEHEQVQLEQDS